MLYFLPFLPGALFLGLVFLKGSKSFGKVYFFNMAGSGLGGLTLLLSMYVILPDRLLLVPLAMWAVGGAIWMLAQGRRVSLAILAVAAVGSAYGVTAVDQIVVSPYKGVSYARGLPRQRADFRSRLGPNGHVEVYQSSYFHFAPGLSDMAALNLTEMPSEAFLGLYIDGSGPIGIMSELPESQQGYFRFLPMYQPFLLHEDPSVFVVQLSGGISTAVALAARRIRRDGGGGQSAAAVRIARQRGDCGLDRAPARAIPASPWCPMTAGCTRPTPRAATTSSISHCPIPPACPAPVASRCSSNTLHGRKHGQLHARPDRRRRAVGDDLEPPTGSVAAAWTRTVPRLVCKERAPFGPETTTVAGSPRGASVALVTAVEGSRTAARTGLPAGPNGVVPGATTVAVTWVPTVSVVRTGTSGVAGGAVVGAGRARDTWSRWVRGSNCRVTGVSGGSTVPAGNCTTSVPASVRIVAWPATDTAWTVPATVRDADNSAETSAGRSVTGPARPAG